MERLRFVEPFRSLASAPHYLAHELGLFAGEGLEAELEPVATAGGVARALTAGVADLGLQGPSRVLAAADRGEAPLCCVGEFASRVSFFLVGRTPAERFAWRDLVGRRVLVASEAPTPRLCLEYLLERHGVAPAAVGLGADLPDAHAIEGFLAGRAEYLLQDQPAVERLLAAGQAHLAAALGPALGHVASGGYLAIPRRLAQRGEVVEAALRALCRAQQWLAAHGPDEIAARVSWAFPGLDRGLLAAAVRRLAAARTWGADPVPRRQGFDALQEILLLRGFIRRSHAYEALVDTGRAEAAVRVVAARGRAGGA